MRVLFEVSPTERLTLRQRLLLIRHRRRVLLENDGQRVWATIP